MIPGTQLLLKSKQMGGSPASCNVQLEWIAKLRPDRVLLDALAGTTLLRTDQNGWIQLRTDG